MGFKELKRIIQDRTRRLEETGLNAVQYQEMERAKTLLEQLRTNHNIAYKQRKDNWFKGHPEQQWFSPSLEETRKDTKLEEWIWHFVSRIFERTPKQRHQDERNHGWYHLSDVHDVDGPCIKGCRFWPEEGRIEDIEILEDYKDYDRFDEVLKIWTEQR